MITAAEQEQIRDPGYVSEHVPDYVMAISGAEPFLLGDFLAYVKKDHLIFVGYPLNESLDQEAMGKALHDSVKRFRPREVAVTAPVLPVSIGKPAQSSSDDYYRLDLSTLSISQKLRNTLNRAGRELSVRRS
jgi:hypothetical protein